MANGEGSSNNVAIVALIVIGVLIAGGAALYLSGAAGGRTSTVVEQPASETQPARSGYKFSHENEDGSKTEIEAP